MRRFWFGALTLMLAGASFAACSRSSADGAEYAIITAKDPVVTLDGHKFRAHINHAFSSNYTIQLTLVDTIAGNLIGVQDMTLDLKAVIDYFRQSNLALKDTDGNVINTPLITTPNTSRRSTRGGRSTWGEPT